MHVVGHFDRMQGVNPKVLCSTQCKSTRASQENGCGGSALRSGQAWRFISFWAGYWLNQRSCWG